MYVRERKRSFQYSIQRNFSWAASAVPSSLSFFQSRFPNIEAGGVSDRLSEKLEPERV